MKTKLNIFMCLMLMVALASCMSINIKPTPKTTFYDAVTAFDDMWESYHKVWSALDEETKAEWVDKYHTKFDTASDFLDSWATAINDPTNPAKWDVIENMLEDLLISLMIK